MREPFVGARQRVPVDRLVLRPGSTTKASAFFMQRPFVRCSFGAGWCPSVPRTTARAREGHARSRFRPLVLAFGNRPVLVLLRDQIPDGPLDGLVGLVVPAWVGDGRAGAASVRTASNDKRIFIEVFSQVGIPLTAQVGHY
jgi:hypothetical protein